MSDMKNLGEKLFNGALLETAAVQEQRIHQQKMAQIWAQSSQSSGKRDTEEIGRLQARIDRLSDELIAKDALMHEWKHSSRAFAAIASLVRQEVMSASSIADLQLSRDPVSLDRLQKFFEDTFRSAEKLEPKYKPEEKTIAESGSGLVSLAIISAKHGGEYSGEHSNGNREGRGKHVWPNGTWMEGTWRNDALTGHATHQWADGCVFVGNFDEGVRNGKGRNDLSGDSSKPKSYFDGEYKLGYFTNGEIAYKSGALKRGSFEWDREKQDYTLVDGEETALNAEGHVEFKGTVKNRQRVSGYFKFADGTTFEGDLLEPITGDDKQRRKGTLKLPSVEIQGEFVGFGKAEGKFRAKFADGTVFEGQDGTISGDKILSCEGGVAVSPDGKRVGASVENGDIKKKTLFGRIFG